MRFAALTPVFLLALAACTSQGADPLGLMQSPAGANLGDYSFSGGSEAEIGVDPKAVIGEKLSAFLNADDRGAAALAAARAASLPHGQKVAWQRTSDVGDSTAAGDASAIGAPFKDSAGRACRFVQETAKRGSDSVSDAVKICNSPAGWVPA